MTGNDRLERESKAVVVGVRKGKVGFGQKPHFSVTVSRIIEQ